MEVGYIIVQSLLVLLLVALAFVLRELAIRFGKQEDTYRAALQVAHENSLETLQKVLVAEREARLRSEAKQIDERLRLIADLGKTPQQLADAAAAASPEWVEAHMTDEERAERERKAAEIDAQLAGRGIVAPGPVGA